MGMNINTYRMIRERKWRGEGGERCKPFAWSGEKASEK